MQQPTLDALAARLHRPDNAPDVTELLRRQVLWRCAKDLERLRQPAWQRWLAMEDAAASQRYHIQIIQMDALKVPAAADPPSNMLMQRTTHATEPLHDIQRRLEHVSTLYTSINGILAQGDSLVARISEDGATTRQHVTDAEAAVLRRYNMDMHRPAHWKPVILCVLVAFVLTVILLST